jgi:glycosyltransferase involved in cell wall biosynthesis
MRILVDGYWWPDGPLSNRIVLQEIVRQWTADYPDDQLTLAIPGDTPAQVPPGVEVARTRLRVHPAINFLELPVLARRHGADAILAFNFAAKSKAGVVFLHDVLFQSNPEWFTRIERAYFSAMPALLSQAHSVVATSRTEHDRIKRHNPHLRRVVSCGLAVPNSLTEADATDPGLGLADQGFLLCVGRLNVRKNLETTLRAALHSGAVSRDFPLVIVGEQSGRITQFDADLRSAADAGVLRFADRLSEAELKWLYTRCAAFIYMSLDEGFGLPPVEAASLGCRVLASGIPIFRETIGGYATLVDPHDIDAIATALRATLATQSDSQPTPYRPSHTWRSVCEVIRGQLQEACAQVNHHQRSEVS